MSISRTDALSIASRYATAIFSLAADAGKEEQVIKEIGAVAEAISGEAELLAAFSNPLLSRDKKNSMLAALAKNANKLTQQALNTIGVQGRAELLPEIAEQLKAKLAASRGEILADIESARALPAPVQKQLAEALKKATGKNVQMNFREDPELLGGVAIQVGSLRLDATLAGALNNMHHALLSDKNN